MKKEHTEDLMLIEKGYPFTWGDYVKTHSIVNFDIVECIRDDSAEETSFHSYVDGECTKFSFKTLNEALLHCLFYKNNDTLVSFLSKGL